MHTLLFLVGRNGIHMQFAQCMFLAHCYGRELQFVQAAMTVFVYLQNKDVPFVLHILQ